MKEYSKNEFCISVPCGLIDKSKKHCLKIDDRDCCFTAAEFHTWLKDNQYVIVEKEIKQKVECCNNILQCMKKEIQDGKQITEEMVNTAIRFLGEEKIGSFDLKDYGFKDIHKQGFIV